jgi:hypothetical protein
LIWRYSDALTYKLQIGRYYIIDSVRTAHHHMYHECQIWDKYLQRIVYVRPDPFRPHIPRKTGWRCMSCDKTPSEELLATYLLLEMDYAQELIAGD